jgi:predicted metallo-beta-lactamase superfamily hydrolase
MSDKRILENHGTKLIDLKPSSLWAAAEADLERKKHNAEADIATVKHYAFHRDHVKKAVTPNDIIRAALKEPGKGLYSSKYATRIIYSDPEILRAALR